MLSKMDIKALREATSVVFRYQDKQSTIECSKSQPNSPWGDASYVISVGTYPICTKLITAFEMIHSAQFSNAWQTIAKLLKPKDKLSLNWYIDAGTTEEMRKEHKHCDHLYIIVDRGSKWLAFFIDYQIASNSLHRMCKLT